MEIVGYQIFLRITRFVTLKFCLRSTPVHYHLGVCQCLMSVDSPNTRMLSQFHNPHIHAYSRMRLVLSHQLNFPKLLSHAFSVHFGLPPLYDLSCDLFLLSPCSNALEVFYNSSSLSYQIHQLCSTWFLFLPHSAVPYVICRDFFAQI